MEIQKVISHFRSYREGDSFTFLTDEWRMRRMHMTAYGHWDKDDWPLLAEFVPSFEKCLSLIASSQWRAAVDPENHASAIYLIDNISHNPIPGRRKTLPTYAVLECYAAWRDVLNHVSSPKKRSVNNWFDINLSSVRRSFLQQLNQAIESLRQECDNELVDSARLSLGRIERNILVQPWAFDNDDRIEFLNHLEEVVTFRSNIRRLYALSIRLKTEEAKAMLVNPSKTSPLAEDPLLSQESEYFVKYSLGLREEWDNLEVWESQLRRIASLFSATQPGDVIISSYGTSNRLFNCESLGEFLARCPRIDQPYTFALASDKLLDLIGADESAMLRNKWMIISDHLQKCDQTDPLIVNMMAHFCYGVIISGVCSADTECALDVLVSLLSDLTSVVAEYGKCDIAFARSLLQQLHAERTEVESVLVGDAFHYFAPASQPNSFDRIAFPGSEGEGSYSSSTGQPTKLFSLSAVRVLFEDAASLVERSLDNKSTREHFSMFGFTSKTIAPVNDAMIKTGADNAVRSSSAGEPSDRTKRLSVLASASVAFRDVAESRSHFEALAAISQLDNSDSIRYAMDQEAEEICKDIRTQGRLSSSLAVRVGKKKLQGPEAVRRCIARRVFARWAIHCGDEMDTGRKLGFIKVLDPKSEREKIQHRKDLENFQKYQREWGVRDLSYTDPLNSISLTQEERDFVLSHPE